MAKRDDKYWEHSFKVNGDRRERRPRSTKPVPHRITVEAGEDGHECARGQRCASVKTVEQPDGTMARVPGFTYQVFCPADSDQIVDALAEAELPDSYARLEDEYGTPASRSKQVIRAPFGPSIPIRTDIDALQREAPQIIGGWAARVRSVPGLQLSAAKYPPDTPEGFAEACKVLHTHPGPLFSLQPYEMTRTYNFPVGRPGKESPSPIPPELVDQIGDLEILHIGVDFVTVQVFCDGATAGNDIFGLHWRMTAVLGKLRGKPQKLIGVPCRADGCGWMTLVRAEPPSDPDDPGDYSICLKCRDRMDEKNYKEWVAMCEAYERHRVRTPAKLENLPGVA